MTTPERGLFERVDHFFNSGLFTKVHGRQLAKEACEYIEQRLAEAEQDKAVLQGYLGHAVKSGTPETLADGSTPTNALADFIKRDMEGTIAQLRARCGELEDALYLIGMSLEQLGLDTSDVEEALGADGIKAVEARARQPAQQDECTRAGKHDWGSITGGMSCYKCGTPWWTNTPEPKPAQEQKP